MDSNATVQEAIHAANDAIDAVDLAAEFARKAGAKQLLDALNSVIRELRVAVNSAATKAAETSPDMRRST
jgi:hypothetical protein